MIVFVLGAYYNVIMRMCPRCKAELHKKHYKGVQVDECLKCHGLFFDQGELEQARDNADEDLRWLDFVLFSTKGLEKLQQDILDCPNCSSPMESLQYKGSSVIINKCPKCKGVFLDNGEFEKMLSYLKRLVASESSSELSVDWRKQAVEVLTGPKKESEEMKDLMAVTRLLEERWFAEHPTIERILEVYYELTPFK